MKKKVTDREQVLVVTVTIKKLSNYKILVNDREEDLVATVTVKKI